MTTAVDMASVRRSVLERLFPADASPAAKNDCCDDGCLEMRDIESVRRQSQHCSEQQDKPSNNSFTVCADENVEPSEEFSTSMGGGKLCSICLERLDDRALVHTTCDHTFHRECILSWMSQDHDDCPSCRFAPLYDVEKYNSLLAEHPDAEPTTEAPATTNPHTNPMNQYRLVYCVVIALGLQMAVMSFFIYGPSSRTEQEEPVQLINNLTMSCQDVYIPFERFTFGEAVFCTAKTKRRSCTVCASMEPDECLCFCRDEMGVSGIQYTSKCCTCTRTPADDEYE